MRWHGPEGPNCVCQHFLIGCDRLYHVSISRMKQTEPQLVSWLRRCRHGRTGRTFYSLTVRMELLILPELSLPCTHALLLFLLIDTWSVAAHYSVVVYYSFWCFTVIKSESPALLRPLETQQDICCFKRPRASERQKGIGTISIWYCWNLREKNIGKMLKDRKKAKFSTCFAKCFCKKGKS